MKLFKYLLFSVIIIILVTNCKMNNAPYPGSSELDSIYNTLESEISLSPSEACKKIDSTMLFLDKDKRIYYDLLLLKAKAKFFLSENDSVFSYLDNIESYCNSIESQENVSMLLSRVYNMRGNIYARNAVLDSAVMCFKRAYNYSKKVGLSKNIIDIALNLADSYVRSGRFDMGSYWYRYSLSVSDTLSIPNKERFPSYYGLAQVYMELRDYAQCDYYYDLAGKYYNEMLTYEKHIYLNNRGNSYYFRGDYDKALEYFMRTWNLVADNPDAEFERNLTMVNLAEVYLKLNNTDSASYYIEKSYPFFVQQNNISALYYIDTQMMELALKKGNIEKARQIASKTVTPGTVELNMINIRNKFLQQYFEKSGDYKNALFYNKENNRIDDSIRSERIKMRAAEIALKYKQDSTLMQKELFIKEKDNEVLRLHQWLFILVIFFIIVIAAVVIAIVYRKRKQDRKMWNMQTAISSLKLQNVRNRISPHFVFNVLNREMATYTDDADKSNLNNLVKLIRKNLELTESVSVSLESELDFVRTYISIEEKTMGDDFCFRIDVDPDIDTNSFSIPSMMIQIPVENAIKHALRNKEGRRRLYIKVSNELDFVKITITDNGGGYRPVSANRGTGTGLKVITHTIQLLNLFNKQQILMNVSNVKFSDTETGCEVKYCIPKNYVFRLKNK